MHPITVLSASVVIAALAKAATMETPEELREKLRNLQKRLENSEEMNNDDLREEIRHLRQRIKALTTGREARKHADDETSSATGRAGKPGEKSRNDASEGGTEEDGTDDGSNGGPDGGTDDGSNGGPDGGTDDVDPTFFDDFA